jgi:hypothetical protein
MTPTQPTAQPTHADILAALIRVNSSQTFAKSPRLRELLTFVVFSTLKGDTQDIKETTIGVTVFGRSPYYDPEVDTIVRSQAWRLRKKLKEYYSREGIEDQLVVDIPKGRYVPTFRRRSDDSFFAFSVTLAEVAEHQQGESA